MKLIHLWINFLPLTYQMEACSFSSLLWISRVWFSRIKKDCIVMTQPPTQDAQQTHLVKPGEPKDSDVIAVSLLLPPPPSPPHRALPKTLILNLSLFTLAVLYREDNKHQLCPELWWNFLWKCGTDYNHQDNWNIVFSNKNHSIRFHRFIKTD